MRATVVAALLCALAAVGPAAAAPRFGIADDAGKYADDGGPAFFERIRALGMTDNRITILWHPDRPAAIVERAFLDRAVPTATAQGVRIVFHVYPAQPRGLTAAPVRQVQFARFLGQLARAYPDVREFVVGNEPNQPRFWQPQFTSSGRGASARSYATLLARSYDALKAVSPEIKVIGLGLSGRGNDVPYARSNASTSPVRFLRDLGAAYRTSGRRKPLMDELGVHPYPRSDRDSVLTGDRWPRAGLVNLGRVKQAFWDAFAGTAQPTVEDGLKLRIDEIGWQVAVPESRAGAYTGRETSSVTSEPAQAANYVKLVQLAACDPSISGLYLLHLKDDPDLERFQSGLERADGSRRPAFAAVRQAVLRARRGCAGKKIAWRHATTVVGARAGVRRHEPAVVAPATKLELHGHGRRGGALPRRHLPRARHGADARPVAREPPRPGSTCDDHGQRARRVAATGDLQGPAARTGAVRVRGAAAGEHEHAPGEGARQPPVRRALAVLRLLALEIHDPVGVALALGAHRAGELVVTVRLRVATLLLQGAAERVVRVVVGRRELEHRAELALRLAPALDPEVRDPERLPDRRLVRLEPLRLLERDRGLRGHALLEMVASALVEVVRVAHCSRSGAGKAGTSARWGGSVEPTPRSAFRYVKFSISRSSGVVRSRVGPISIPATRSPASIAC